MIDYNDYRIYQDLIQQAYQEKSQKFIQKINNIPRKKTKKRGKRR